MYFAQYPSPLGDLLLSCKEDALTGIWMDRALPEQTASHPLLEQTKSWLDDYFQGKNPPISLPLAPEGTAFQKCIWDILLTIPYGSTCTYGQVAAEAAHRLGKARMSAQAAGGAIGSNPISILIPCHRVVGANGSLTGYGGGLERKLWLLHHEGMTQFHL